MKAENETGRVVYRRNPDLIGATIDDELVMMSVEQGQYYGLGGVGPRVWDLLAESRSFSELVGVILDEYDVDRTVCERDMQGFLEQMESLGLVERT